MRACLARGCAPNPTPALRGDPYAPLRARLAVEREPTWCERGDLSFLLWGSAPHPGSVAPVVRKGGFEPPRPLGHRILNPARLPVPPLSRGLRFVREGTTDRDSEATTPRRWSVCRASCAVPGSCAMVDGQGSKLLPNHKLPSDTHGRCGTTGGEPTGQHRLVPGPDLGQWGVDSVLGCTIWSGMAGSGPRRSLRGFQDSGRWPRIRSTRLTSSTANTT